MDTDQIYQFFITEDAGLAQLKSMKPDLAAILMLLHGSLKQYLAPRTSNSVVDVEMRIRMADTMYPKIAFLIQNKVPPGTKPYDAVLEALYREANQAFLDSKPNVSTPV